MELTTVLIGLCVLLYFLIGQLVLICYLWSIGSEGTPLLGIMGICWPVVLLIDLVLYLGSWFMALSRWTHRKVRRVNVVDRALEEDL